MLNCKEEMLKLKERNVENIKIEMLNTEFFSPASCTPSSPGAGRGGGGGGAQRSDPRAGHES